MLTNRELTEKNIISSVKTIYQNNYGNDNTTVIEVVLADVIDLFNGKKRGFQKCDVTYHNITHTLQTVNPFIEIIDGWNRNGDIPRISKEYFDSGIIAVLLHDTGYIKAEGDNDGTGAKYTFLHIQRSIDFTDTYLHQKGFDTHSILSIENAIRCTGVGSTPESIHFNSEEERIIGYALGTADLLGQMSSPDYLQKLPSLFTEFEEAYCFEGMDKTLNSGVKIFNNADELLLNTEYFYKNIAMDRLSKMGSMYTYLPYHFKTSDNPYIEAIEENIRKIQALSP
ncbi:MAG: hypothetical protein C0392_14825 [Syntrophus sp. (in: bacteria)]|nr:hypothetical protein [Syntrophus sp. (in: bacteria)]